MKKIFSSIFFFMMIHPFLDVSASTSLEEVSLEGTDVFNSAFIIEVTRPTGVFTCTGIAVSRKVILTAAHCLDGDIESIKVSNYYLYRQPGSFLDVKTYSLHPLYDHKKSNYLFDVAKIKLQQKLPSEIEIFPIRDLLKAQDKTYYRIGYGGRNNRNKKTILLPTLRKVDFANHVIELNEDDSRSGDSGGPILMVNDKGKVRILAIHSTLSSGPRGYYSYNVLLGALQSWIFEPF